MIDHKELERELLELCERVAGARARYIKLRDIQSTIGYVSGYSAAESKQYIEAKQLLSEKLNEQAMSEDNLWRQLIIGCAERIINS